MGKYRKFAITFSVIGLLLILTGVTYSFFNYTKTGLANNFRVGNISFNTSQNGNINLTNVFPIKSSELGTYVGNHDSVTVSITGNTDYSEGIEYLVTIDQVNSRVNGKKIPMSFTAEVNNVGTISNDYFNDRGGNSSIYTLYETGKILNGKYLLAGFIKSGETISGSITITAYVDADRIAISDTYLNGGDTSVEWVNGRTVFTTDEWRSFQGNNALSFKIKVEANEGIWVRDINEDTPSTCFTTSGLTTIYEYNSNRNSTDINNCVTYFTNKGWSVDTNNGETLEDFCAGTGTSYSADIQGYLDNDWFSSSEKAALEGYNIINNIGNTVFIDGYDESCGPNVAIPEIIDVYSYSYTISSNISQEQAQECSDFLGGELEWSCDHSNNETLEDLCANTGTNWGRTLQDLVNDDFGEYELSRLAEIGILTSEATATTANVKEINMNAFSNMNIKTLVLPEGLKRIGSYAFRDNQIEEVVIPDSVITDICVSHIFDMGVDITQGGKTYSCGCMATYVNDNDTVTISGYEETCPKDVVIPNKIDGKVVTKIGLSAFKQKGITSVVIPDTVTDIGDDAFRSNNLTSITLPSSLTTIGMWAFEYNQITSLVIPEGVTNVKQDAFYYNRITSLTLPSTLRYIGNYAFSSNQITDLVIPDGVKSISTRAFFNNPLERLTIPSSVTLIQSYDTFSLDNITYLSTDAPSSSNLHIPANGLDTLIIGSNVTNLPYCGYQENGCSINSLEISSTYILTKDYASYSTNQNPFVNRWKINNVKIGNNITRLGNNVFRNNTITSVTLPNTLTEIGTGTFANNSITSLSIPGNITTIGSASFLDNSISSLTISNGVTTIRNGAFSSNNLTTVSLPNSVRTIENYAFSSNDISTITVGNGATSIGESAFFKSSSSGYEGNLNLTSVTIDKTCSVLKNMSGYPFIGTTDQAGTTIYGSSNEVCDSY